MGACQRVNKAMRRGRKGSVRLTAMFACWCRDTVEDSTVLRLAGVEEYPPQNVRRATPLTSVPPPQLRSILERMA